MSDRSPGNAQMPNRVDVMIVGAGIAGLMAANRLNRPGRTVVVVDKGRGVGGRIATRRIGEATFDHGAQFMTTRDPVFSAAVDQWIADGVVEKWFGSQSGMDSVHPRFRGAPAMTAIPKRLAQGLTVALGQRVRSISQRATEWTVSFETGLDVSASSVILTAPVPQSLDLLDAGNVRINDTTRQKLETVRYERCLAVMAVLGAPSRIPEPGGYALQGGPIAWVADNRQKGTSAVPAVTIHASGSFSKEAWDDNRESVAQTLLGDAAGLIGAPVTEYQVHGWKFSKPETIVDGRFAEIETTPSLLLAGDAFGGPRVEGAALSGIAAAEYMEAKNQK